MIKVKKIRKVFGKDVVALDEIDLNIKEREFIALLGPSGCGKSTTLNVISGLLDPTSGSVFFNDKDVTNLEPKDRNIGMVFQSYALYPHLKVLDNIAFPLKQKGMSKSDRHEKAREIAKKIKIDYLLDRKPDQLSGGQQQRVAMARALVREPAILLLDEPMSNLDARLKIEIREEIKRIQKESGVTAIIVTHDQEEAMAIADKIAILDNGKIQQFGSPDELYYNPKNLFVAHFMGTPPMNFLSGILKKEGLKYILQGNGFSHNLDDKISTGINDFENREMKIGIRPHQVQLCENKKSAIKINLHIVEDLGREIVLTGMIGDERFRVLIDKLPEKGMGYFNNILSSENPFIYIDIIEEIVLFDTETGVNIMYDNEEG
jgi:ABC-type sugar transport system ATPase subunit